MTTTFPAGDGSRADRRPGPGAAGSPRGRSQIRHGAALSTRLAAFALVIALVAPHCRAQAEWVQETDTPIARHYAAILERYVGFVKSTLGTGEDLIDASKRYFDGLGYRTVVISIAQTGEPRLRKSWKLAGSKLAVLPRMTYHPSPDGPTVRLYDQGDDYVLLQNHADGRSAEPGLFVSVGITHHWK